MARFAKGNLFIGAEHGAAWISRDEHADDFAIVFLKGFVPPAGRIPEMFGGAIAGRSSWRDTHSQALKNKLYVGRRRNRDPFA